MNSILGSRLRLLFFLVSSSAFAAGLNPLVSVNAELQTQAAKVITAARELSLAYQGARKVGFNIEELQKALAHGAKLIIEENLRADKSEDDEDASSPSRRSNRGADPRGSTGFHTIKNFLIEESDEPRISLLFLRSIDDGEIPVEADSESILVQDTPPKKHKQPVTLQGQVNEFAKENFANHNPDFAHALEIFEEESKALELLLSTPIAARFAEFLGVDSDDADEDPRQIIRVKQEKIEEFLESYENGLLPMALDRGASENDVLIQWMAAHKLLILLLKAKFVEGLSYDLQEEITGADDTVQIVIWARLQASQLPQAKAIYERYSRFQLPFELQNRMATRR